MLIDCFMLLNELDLLESRMEYLCGVVDKFLIVESNLTFNGEEKPLHYLENKSRFKKWQHRILYQPFITQREDWDWSQPTDSSTFTGPQWNIEHAQRNSIVELTNRYFDRSIRIIIGDIDEIPNKQMVMDAFRKLSAEKFALTFEQDMFYYNFEKKQATPWAGSTITTLDVIQQFKPQWVRDNRWYFDKIKNGGWHVSNFSEPEMIKYKIENFSHQEFNTDKFTDLNHIKQQINNHEDIFARDNSFVAFNKYSLPTTFLRHFEKHEVTVR